MDDYVYIDRAFQAGDVVEIIDNTVDHGFEIGEVVTIERADVYEDCYEVGKGYNTIKMDLYADDWIFDADDCKLLKGVDERG